jgi:peptidoglycan/xylan/chitin deacetylase (PgdA/CDA1 family)
MRRILWTAVLVCGLASAANGATELAVTVDDLPAHGPLPPDMQRVPIAERLISALRRHGVRAVGFVNGGQLREHPERADIAQRWLQAGFPVGNHTFSHLDINHVTAAEYIADIERNEAVLAEVAGGHWARVFRYPYLHEGESGETREAVRRWLAAHGYTIAPVTVTFEDWAWNDAYARCAARRDASAIAWLKHSFLEAAVSRLKWSQAAAEVTFGRPIRQILLVHVGAFDAVMMDDLLEAYQHAGVTMIDLKTALADPVYQVKTDEGWQGESTFLVQVARARGVRIPKVPEVPLEKLRAICR